MEWYYCFSCKEVTAHNADGFCTACWAYTGSFSLKNEPLKDLENEQVG